MGRYSGLAILRWRNASDEIFAVLDVEIAGLVVFSGRNLPAEQGGVEVARALYVGGAEIGPAQGAFNTCDSDAGILPGLPHAESCSGGILEHGHTAGFHHVEGGS